MINYMIKVASQTTEGKRVLNNVRWLDNHSGKDKTGIITHTLLKNKLQLDQRCVMYPWNYTSIRGKQVNYLIICDWEKAFSLWFKIQIKKRQFNYQRKKKTFFMDKVTINKIKRQFIYWEKICNVYHK